MIFFYVVNNRECQMAYKMLMNSNFEFKPFEIKGKNIVEHVKKLGVTKVPSLLISSSTSKKDGLIEGIDDIYKFIQRYDKPDYSNEQKMSVNKPVAKKPTKTVNTTKPVVNTTKPAVNTSKPAIIKDGFSEEDKKLYQDSESSDHKQSVRDDKKSVNEQNDSEQSGESSGYEESGSDESNTNSQNSLERSVEEFNKDEEIDWDEESIEI